MKFLSLLGVVAIGLAFAAGLARAEGLPKTLKMTEAAKLEIVRDGKTTGTVGLAAGAELEVLGLDAEWVRVKFRSLEGRVAVGKTDFVQRMTELTAQAEAAEAAALEAEIKAQAAGLRPEPSRIESILAGKLVRLSGSNLQPVRESELEGVKFYAVYFSASWCGPCRNFTPGLVDAYRDLRKNYPEFEVVFVSNDRSAADMLA